jgi:hypothetical protein
MSHSGSDTFRTLFMPTDGTDFARRKPIYGRFYADARNGAPAIDLAELLVECLAREIRRDRPLIALRPVVNALLSVTEDYGNGALPLLSAAEKKNLLLRRLDALDQTFGEHSSTRHLCENARKIGIEAIDSGVHEWSSFSALAGGLVSWAA